VEQPVAAGAAQIALAAAPSGPREGCDEFHGRDAASSRRPLWPMRPTMAAPCVLLIQLRCDRHRPGITGG